MQQRVMDGLFHSQGEGLSSLPLPDAAFGDPRIQDLLSEFYALRGTLTVRDPDTVRNAMQRLLHLIADTLRDQHALRLVEGQHSQEIRSTQISCSCFRTRTGRGTGLRDRG